MATSPGDEGYNDIYSKLVEDSDDILGIIAYSFYKQQKIEFIQGFRARNSRQPSDEEMKVFYIASNSPASLVSYRTKAEALSREFIDAVVGQHLEEVEEEHDRELTKRIKNLKPTFWGGVAQNIFASVLFVILIGVIVFVTWSLKYGVSDAISGMTGWVPGASAPSQGTQPPKP